MILLLRLLGSLPPSRAYIEMLDHDTVTLDDTVVLHTLRWAPRLSHKGYNSFVKVRLMKFI